jgi:HEAT repeat protein
MEKENIRELINRYNSQLATTAEIKQIEALLEAGSIDLDELKDVHTLEGQVASMEFPSPTGNLDDRFYQMLALERKVKSSFSWRGFFSWPELAPKLALASVTLLIGVGIGYLVKPSASSKADPGVNQQIAELKEMVMLSLLEKESAAERLKAVSLTEQMSAASTKVTGALLETLNNDENVNVRLAAIEALSPYVRDNHVREELIRSIAKQDSPLVQVALAEMMAALHVKSSVKELEKIVKSDKTPADVKTRIKQSIDILI